VRDPAQNVEHYQGQYDGQDRLHYRMVEPVLRKNRCQQLDNRHAGLGQLIEKKLEDQDGNGQGPNGDDAGQNVVLQIA